MKFKGEFRTDLKIKINGKEYQSLDEVPEQFRHLVSDGMKKGLMQASKGGISPQPVFRGKFSLKLGRGGQAGGFSLPPASPQEFRKSIEMMEGGPVPADAPLDRVLAAVFIACLAVGGGFIFPEWRSRFAGNPVRYGFGSLAIIGSSIIGLVALWHRSQRRKLYPVLQEIASLSRGAFVAVISGNPRFCIARETWTGIASFDAGSDSNPAFSRLDAQIPASGTSLSVHSRTFVDRLGLNGPSVAMDDPEFDAHFAVLSGDAETAKRLVDFSIRSLLESLRKNGPVLLEIKDNLAVVRVERDLAIMHGASRRESDMETLKGFLGDASAIVDYVARKSAI